MKSELVDGKNKGLLVGTGLPGSIDIQEQWDQRSRMEGQNAASMYVSSLMSVNSRRSARSALNSMAWLLAGQDIHTMPWGRMTANVVSQLVSIMSLNEFGLARVAREPRDKGYVDPLFLRRAIVLANGMSNEAIDYVEHVDVVSRIYKECDAGRFEGFDRNRKMWASRSPATLRAYLSHLRGVAKFAKDANQMTMRDYIAIKELKPPRGRKARKQSVITAAEVVETMDGLLSSIESKDANGIPASALIRDYRDAAILAILVGCGLRRDEVRLLKTDDVSVEGGEYGLLIHGKGNKERPVALPEWVVPVFSGWLSIRGAQPGALFVGIKRRGKSDVPNLILDHAGRVQPASENMVYRVITKHFGNRELSVAPHDMRRAFATMMLDNDVPIRFLSMLLGHSDIRTTMTYDLSDEQAAQSALKAQPRPT